MGPSNTLRSPHHRRELSRLERRGSRDSIRKRISKSQALPPPHDFCIEWSTVIHQQNRFGGRAPHEVRAPRARARARERRRAMHAVCGCYCGRWRAAPPRRAGAASRVGARAGGTLRRTAVVVTSGVVRADVRDAARAVGNMAAGDMDVNAIIDKLLEVRGARPGKTVALTEMEIRYAGARMSGGCRPRRVRLRVCWCLSPVSLFWLWIL